MIDQYLMRASASSQGGSSKDKSLTRVRMDSSRDVGDGLEIFTRWSSVGSDDIASQYGSCQWGEGNGDKKILGAPYSRGRGFRVSFRYPFPILGDRFRSMREIRFGFPCHVFISGPFDLIRDIFSTSMSHDTLYLPLLFLINYIGWRLREIGAMCSIFDKWC